MNGFVKLGTAIALVLLLGGCKDLSFLGEDHTQTGENHAQIEENGLTKDINALVSEDILKTIMDLGMPIYKGDKPPEVEGIYKASPFVLKASNRLNDTVGYKFSDKYIRCYNQNSSALTIKIDYRNGPESGNVLNGFIVGKGDQFTIFTKINGDYGGQKFISIQIFSGTIAEKGIKDFHEANFMIDDKGDSEDVLIENGQGRIVHDSDGMSETVDREEFDAQ